MRAKHPELGPADLLIAGTRYQREAIRRALVRPEVVPGAGIVPTLTVEDVIVHKLIAGRYRDLADVEEILASETPIQEGYIEEWAGFWEVLDRWRLLRGQGEGG